MSKVDQGWYETGKPNGNFIPHPNRITGCVWSMKKRVFNAWLDAIDKDVLSRAPNLRLVDWLEHVAPLIKRIRKEIR